jgi:hypothetical protein
MVAEELVDKSMAYNPTNLSTHSLRDRNVGFHAPGYYDRRNIYTIVNTPVAFSRNKRIKSN